MRSKSLFVVLSVAALCSVASANLVMNGGFETGALNPEWTELPASNSNFGISMDEAFEGTYSLRFGNAHGFLDTVEQILPIVNGQTYEISMWVKNYGVGNDGLVIEFGGSTAAYMEPVPTGLESWEQISFTHTVVTDVQRFRIRGHDQVGFYVDNISVTPVPEPASMASLALGAAAWIVRRKGQRMA